MIRRDHLVCATVNTEFGHSIIDDGVCSNNLHFFHLHVAVLHIGMLGYVVPDSYSR